MTHSAWVYAAILACQAQRSDRPRIRMQRRIQRTASDLCRTGRMRENVPISLDRHAADGSPNRNSNPASLIANTRAKATRNAVAMSEFIDAQSVREYMLELQQRIVAAFEKLDGAPFKSDRWEKPADAVLGGGGLTRIIEGGKLLERGGVGFSHVLGARLPPSASAQRPELAGRGFEAMGVSLVFHPRNPHVPTVHMNIRFFIARHGAPGATTQGAAGGLDSDAAARVEDAVWWFGGGMDLTPYYATEENARPFPTSCAQALAPFR